MALSQLKVPACSPTYVGKVEKTWAYDGAASLQMPDQAAIRILNAHDGNEQSQLERFTFTRRLKNAEPLEYEVDTHAMTSTNKESKRVRALQRMQLRILLVDDMLEAGTIAPFIALLNDDWRMRWQSEEVCGWKNLSAEGNEVLCSWLASSNVLEEWVHPRDNKEQLLRLVAIKEWEQGWLLR